MKEHHYQITMQWTGNEGSGTSSYKTYNRDHIIRVDEKYSLIHGSSDPAFMGNKMKYNPEELFVSSLSSCHMLWYLHLCSEKKIIVLDYIDEATGKIVEDKNGGRFVEVVLSPQVTVESEEMIPEAESLHQRANQMCFIANSCNFEIKHSPKIIALNTK